MGQPAARLTDMHTCPMFDGPVPHVGGPIVAPGEPSVLIGALPAARITDECVCVGPPDVIAEGSPVVLIGGLPAARLGDVTVHGGVIVLGDFTVLIGDGGGDDDDDDTGADDASDDDGADDGGGDGGGDDDQNGPDGQDDQQTQQTTQPQQTEELHAVAQSGNFPDTPPPTDADAAATDSAAAASSSDSAATDAAAAGGQAPDGAFKLNATENDYNPAGTSADGYASGGAADSFGPTDSGVPDGGLATGESAPPGAFKLSASQDNPNPSASPAPYNPFKLSASQNTYIPPASPPAPARLPPFKLGVQENVSLPPPKRPTAPPATGAPPGRSAGFVPGALSAHYESNGNPGTISGGVGDHGGSSYGAYQMIKGNVASFVNHEGAQWPALQGKAVGSAAFNKAWKEVAAKDPAGFLAAQHAYISRTHYEPQVAQISQTAHVDIGTRSQSLQDVVWSTSVQHGPTTSIISGAIHKVEARGMTPNDPGFDHAVINAVYAERGRTNPDGTLVHFHSSSREVQLGVASRFRSERLQALRQLDLQRR